MSKLAGKVALITGGTSGIGEATTRLFVKNNAKVVFTGRREDIGLSLEKELNSESGETVALFVKADHRLPEDCERCVSKTIQTFGKIHILFNNAGIVFLQNSENTSEQEWADVFSLNVTSVWRMTKLVLPWMRKNSEPENGTIINNSSDWGVVGGTNAVAYCASKGAVNQMTKAVALDVAKDKIRVNAVCPGDTFVKRWIERDRHLVVEKGEVVDDEEVERRLRVSTTIPMGRTGDVMEIAKAVLFLACSDSSFVTGTALIVDGGNTAQ